MIFWKEMFFLWKTSSENVGNCLKNPAETFQSQSEKNSVSKLLFKKNVFPQKVDLVYNVKFWQLCWSLLSNLKSKPLKIRSQGVRSIFFKKFVFHQSFLGTYKMHLCQTCCKIFAENTEKIRLKTEEECEKKPFSKGNVLHEDVPMDK